MKNNGNYNVWGHHCWKTHGNTINTAISYRDLNYDIIQVLAIQMIGDKDVEKSLYSIEDCELFKGFCILNNHRFVGFSRINP